MSELTLPSQQEVIAFLADPAAYPGNPPRVDIIETHAAMVFLAGDRAYKLKRAVVLPYLDFSTLEKRHAVLLRELDVNARFSPNLYKRVLAVAADNEGKLSIGGSGVAVDWLLEMRRFDQGALLNVVAQTHGLHGVLLEKLARVILSSHDVAEPSGSGLGVGRLIPVIDTLDTTFHKMRAALSPFPASPYIKDLRREAGRQSDLLRQREERGFVRRCHGDLHLKNIVVWNGEPTLFDALEFDDRLATIDVLYDLAFLLMDLWHQGLRSEANLVFNHYFQAARLEDIEGLCLLPLFLSLRAAIRTMTSLDQLALSKGNCLAALRQDIQGYAALANACLRKTPPTLVAMGGPSGTGKTMVARHLAASIGSAPGALHLRTDIERKAMAGVAPSQRLPEAAYEPDSRAEVYRRVLDKAEAALHADHSVIVDAVFPDNESRTRVQEVARRAKRPFCGFWLAAPRDVLFRRIKSRTNDASDAGPAVLAHQLETITPPPEWTVIDASGSLPETVQNVLKVLKQPLDRGESR